MCHHFLGVNDKWAYAVTIYGQCVHTLRRGGLFRRTKRLLVNLELGPRRVCKLHQKGSMRMYGLAWREFLSIKTTLNEPKIDLAAYARPANNSHSDTQNSVFTSRARLRNTQIRSRRARAGLFLSENVSGLRWAGPLPRRGDLELDHAARSAIARSVFLTAGDLNAACGRPNTLY